MDKYGLLGRNISYSFSQSYFQEKFKELQISAEYQNFDLQDLSELKDVLKRYEQLRGLNVTIPYKEKVLPYLNELDPVAEEIGAVNTIEFLSNGSLKGHNTDYYGFMESLRPLLYRHHKKALILGTGGASKAVKYALETLGIAPTYVSRSPGNDHLTYDKLNKTVLEEHLLIVNCTPLGTYPDTSQAPEIPYRYLTKNHLAYDLIYNPSETAFMAFAAEQGAFTTNGLQMLKLQAEKAWQIWNT